MEPPVKRKKCLGEKENSWEILPVLSDELLQDVQVVDAYAAPVINKKETSRLIRDLSAIYPLTRFPHIKRVRACKAKPHPLEIIICPVDDAPDVEGSQEANIDSVFSSQSFNRNGLGDPFVVKIPARAPLTRGQFEQASAYWPLSFHEDKQVTAALTGQLFNTNHKAKIQEFMMVAIHTAMAGKKMGMNPVGAVMVDPATDQILAISHDCTQAHPLHHAVMVCIDLVAHGQGGGAYNFSKFPACKFFTGGSQTIDGVTDTSISKSTAGKRAVPYICTSYDLYVTREPCAMCAMALLHSRIGRVFYGSNTSNGGLGTRYKIHTHEKLNHHFEVYRGVLQHLCDDLLVEPR